jgi:hypothetical protein
MRPPIPLAALILALSIAGCAERALGPGDVSGSYGLLRYDNDSLPRVYSTGAGCSAGVEYGALDLSANGTFGLQIVRWVSCPNGGQGWFDLDASGTYQKVNGLWLALRDPARGAVFPAWIRGTHVVVLVPQIPSLSTGAVEVEFAAGATQGNGMVTVPGGNNPLPFPPPVPETLVVITKRP